MIKITHKRVRLTDSGYYIFYPFGPILSKGVVTEKSDLILKAIKLEQLIVLGGFYFGARLSLMSNTTYDQQDHGNIIKR